MTSTSRRGVAAVVGLAVAAVLGLGACGDDSGDGTGSLNPADRSPTPGELQGSANTNVVTLAAADFAFKPSSFEASSGQAVNISFTNTGNSIHNFSSKDFDVDRDLPAGETATVSFTPTKAGEFEFFCKYHAGRKMTGRFTVR